MAAQLRRRAAGPRGHVRGLRRGAATAAAAGHRRRRDRPVGTGAARCRSELASRDRRSRPSTASRSGGSWLPPAPLRTRRRRTWSGSRRPSSDGARRLADLDARAGRAGAPAQAARRGGGPAQAGPQGGRAGGGGRAPAASARPRPPWRPSAMTPTSRATTARRHARGRTVSADEPDGLTGRVRDRHNLAGDPRTRRRRVQARRAGAGRGVRGVSADAAPGPRDGPLRLGVLRRRPRRCARRRPARHGGRGARASSRPEAVSDGWEAARRVVTARRGRRPAAWPSAAGGAPSTWTAFAAVGPAGRAGRAGGAGRRPGRDAAVRGVAGHAGAGRRARRAGRRAAAPAARAPLRRPPAGHPGEPG